MEATGIRDAVLPEGACPDLLGAAIARGLPVDPVLRMAVLVPRAARCDALPGRLRWSREETGQFRAARDVSLVPADPAGDDLRRLLADHALPRLLDRCHVAEAWGEVQGGDPGDWPALRARFAAEPVPVFPLRGQDVLDRGQAPGAAVGRMMMRLRGWWLAGGCRAGRAECLAELDRVLAAEASGPGGGMSGTADGTTAPD